MVPVPLSLFQQGRLLGPQHQGSADLSHENLQLVSVAALHPPCSPTLRKSIASNLPPNQMTGQMSFSGSIGAEDDPIAV